MPPSFSSSSIHYKRFSNIIESEYAELKTVLAELKAENAALKAENKCLKKKLDSIVTLIDDGKVPYRPSKEQQREDPVGFSDLALNFMEEMSKFRLWAKDIPEFNPEDFCPSTKRHKPIEIGSSDSHINLVESNESDSDLEQFISDELIGITDSNRSKLLQVINEQSTEIEPEPILNALLKLPISFEKDSKCTWLSIKNNHLSSNTRTQIDWDRFGKDLESAQLIKINKKHAIRLF